MEVDQSLKASVREDRCGRQNFVTKFKKIPEKERYLFGIQLRVSSGSRAYYIFSTVVNCFNSYSNGRRAGNV